jgi:hypothetical protein
MTITQGSDWMTAFIVLIHSTLTTRNYSAIADLHNLHFTVTHPLGFSVFNSRILATDFNTVIIPVSLNYTLQISHAKSSLHRLTYKSQLTRCHFFSIIFHCSLKRLPQLLFPQLAWDLRYKASSRIQQKIPFQSL